MARYRLLQRGVLDTQDGTVIADISHPKWQDYVSWVIVGNIADPFVVPARVLTQAEIDAQAELDAQAAILATLKADAAVQALRTRTPAAVDAWIDAQVNSLADARAVLKILARILALLARERI